MATRTAKKVVVELPHADPKKRVVKFETDDEDAATRNLYVSKEALTEAFGDDLPDGVRVTIEAL